MDIVKIDGGRFGFDQWHTTPVADGANQSEHRGIRHHLPFFGCLLSVLGLSFKDPNVGYLNRTSVVLYLQRNVNRLGEDTIAEQIQQLTIKSRAADVERVFLAVKAMQAAPQQPTFELSCDKSFTEKDHKDLQDITSEW